MTTEATVNSPTDSGSSPSLADQVYQNSVAGSTSGSSIVGLNAALSVIANFVGALQNLEAAVANMASLLAEITADITNQENEVLNADLLVIQNDPAADDTSKDSSQVNADRSKKISDDQAQYQTDETTFQNAQAAPNALAQQYQTLAGSIAQSVAALINNMSYMIQINSNISRLMQ